jgi:transaldolase
MKNEWFELREKLLFKTPVPDFANACKIMRATYLAEFKTASVDRQQELIRIVTELSIDMQSYLLRWYLQNPAKNEQLPEQIVTQEVAANYGLLVQWGARENVDVIKNEVAAIKRSNLMRLSYLTDQGVMNTRWGHDYATGLTKSLRKGALLVTTNPPLVNLARKDDPETWDAMKNELKRNNPDASPEKLVSLFTMQVVLQNCRELRPIYEATDGQYGYVNLQVSPKNWNNADQMAEEIEFLYDAMNTELHGMPNIVFKVPGVKASLETVKRVTRKGIGVSITLGFSVAQHLAFAEAIEQGNARVSFLVMMNGRLDDPVKEELQQLGLADAAEVAKWCSMAIVRRSYRLLCERGYVRSALLVASLRGPWNIEGAITDGKRPIFITSFPDKTEEYDREDRMIASHITEPIAVDILLKLMHSSLFQQAYEIGGLTADGFDAFFPVVKTLTSFSEAYDEIKNYVVLS